MAAPMPSLRAETEDFVLSLQTTNWDAVADKIRLGLPSVLGWTIVRSEPFNATWHHSRLHPHSQQSPRNCPSVEQEALAPSVAMVEAIRPFLDFGHGVAEVSPSLVRAWKQPLASIYLQAIRNLRVLLDPKLTATSVQGCPIRIFHAGFWTSGSVFDFDYYLSTSDTYSSEGPMPELTRRTLLVGGGYVIWCKNHSLNSDQLEACSIVTVRSFLNSISSPIAGATANQIKPGRNL